MPRKRSQSELPGAAELYARLFAEQGGKCAIRGCKRRPKTRRFHIDHDHKTGAIRGLLCHWHNRIMPKDSREAFALAAYLGAHEAAMVEPGEARVVKAGVAVKRGSCVYCGQPIDRRSVTCAAHADLPKLDPEVRDGSARDGRVS